MDAGALLIGFVPVVSVAIGAGATYFWQVLGNRRTDEAVRAQTNSRLMELTSFVSGIYAAKQLTSEIAPSLSRLVLALDDMQIALAFRKNPDVLWKLGQIRVHCEMMMPLAIDQQMKTRDMTASKVDELRETVQWYAGNILSFIFDAFTDDPMKGLAMKVARGYKFSPEAHHAMVLSEQAKAREQN